MRPIDADRLLDEKRKTKYYHLPNGDIAIPIIDIEHAPTIESKQGEWIIVCDAEGEGDNLYRCSVCGHEYGCQEYDLPNYCGTCGSRNWKGSDDA